MSPLSGASPRSRGVGWWAGTSKSSPTGAGRVSLGGGRPFLTGGGTAHQGGDAAGMPIEIRWLGHAPCSSGPCPDPHRPSADGRHDAPAPTGGASAAQPDERGGRGRGLTPACRPSAFPLAGADRPGDPCADPARRRPAAPQDAARGSRGGGRRRGAGRRRHDHGRPGGARCDALALRQGARRCPGLRGQGRRCDVLRRRHLVVPGDARHCRAPGHGPAAGRRLGSLAAR